MAKDVTKLLSSLEKKYGKGTVRKANEFPPVEFIKCDIPLLNKALTGGIPRGRLIQLWGNPKGGKTSIASLFVGAEQRYQAQQENPKEVFYFDLENTYNIPWTNKLGVDNESLNLIRHGGEDPKGNPISLTAEDVVNMTWDLAESGQVSLIVWDSLSSMTPKAMIEKHDAEKFPVGQLAGLMSYHLPEVIKVLSRTNCTLIVINQIRQKIGVLYGSPDTAPGGKALEHYSSQIIKVRQGDFYTGTWFDEETGEETEKRRIGNDCIVRVEKNKVGPPFGESTFAFMWDRGVDLEQAIADLAIQLRVLRQSGGYFYIDESLLPLVTETDYINMEKGYIKKKENVAIAMKEFPAFYQAVKLECERVLEERD